MAVAWAAQWTVRNSCLIFALIKAEESFEWNLGVIEELEKNGTLLNLKDLRDDAVVSPRDLPSHKRDDISLAFLLHSFSRKRRTEERELFPEYDTRLSIVYLLPESERFIPRVQERKEVERQQKDKEIEKEIEKRNRKVSLFCFLFYFERF